MPDAAWKRIEREVARILEGKRVPSSGAGAIKGDAIQLRLMPGAMVEAKHGEQVLKAGYKTLNKWLKEADKDAHGSLGSLLVLHPPRGKLRDSLVIMRLGLLSDAQKALRYQRKLDLEDDQ